MNQSFKSALREYAVVSLAVAFADLIFAGWVVWDMGAGVPRLFAWFFAVGVMWLITLAFWLIFAAKHYWWVNRRIKQQAAAIVAMNDGTVSQSHATDLLTCPGPCSNPYGCMVGVCVIAATQRTRGRHHVC